MHEYKTGYTILTGYEHMIKHFRKSCAGTGFKIQVIDIFSANDYSKYVLHTAREKRVNREWMKELRTV